MSRQYTFHIQFKGVQYRVINDGERIHLFSTSNNLTKKDLSCFVRYIRAEGFLDNNLNYITL